MAITTLTKKEWQHVEDRMDGLSGVYRPVAFMCDGYHLIVHKHLYKNKLVIGFYVNGTFEGAWFKDCEERRRFFRPVQVFKWNAKARAELKKVSKRRLKEYGYDPDEKRTVHYPWWTSFKALKSHLERHNECIELLKNCEYEPRKTESA